MSNRVAAALIAAGVIAGALVVLPYKLFELDRYFVPKELVLHLVALGVAIVLVVRARDRDTDVVDTLLALFLAWSAASALFATNHWLAQRALGVSVSSAIVFWGARRLGAAGRHRAIVVAGAAAAVCAAVTGLAQAYGLDLVYFSLNRAPGGTFGNRNFVAHFCAIGLPALIYVTVTARRSVGALIGSIGVLAIAMLLVLSRSRGAWLGVGLTIGVGGAALLLSREHWRSTVVRGRFARILLAATVGICVAVALPNRLNWRSDTPYLDSAISVVDYESGSGHGRLVQYSNSMRMALAHPVFGVGPGNWPVEYVRFATRGDGSISGDGMTANPWPSSDWIAFVSERGIAAAGALLGCSPSSSCRLRGSGVSSAMATWCS